MTLSVDADSDSGPVLNFPLGLTVGDDLDSLTRQTFETVSDFFSILPSLYPEYEVSEPESRMIGDLETRWLTFRAESYGTNVPTGVVFTGNITIFTIGTTATGDPLYVLVYTDGDDSSTELLIRSLGYEP
jgi:hypothetical protein